MARITLFAAVLILILGATSIAQPVVKITHDGSSLKSSFNKSFKKGKASGEFWIGYSIERETETQVSIGSFFLDDNVHITLRDVIQNNAEYQKYKSRLADTKTNKRRYSHRIINGRIINRGEPPIDKEFGILFRYDRSSENINDFAEISMCNLSLYVDLENQPLFWLGKSSNQSSFDFVKTLYNNSATVFAREELVPAIGVHTSQKETTDLLSEIYYNNQNDEIKENCLFWIGQQNNVTALRILEDAIKNGESLNLREQAVMSLGFMEFPGVVDRLIPIAKRNSERDLREKALHALGQKAVKKAEDALKDFVENDPDIELKKHAIYALSNSSNDQLPYLIQIAKSNESLTLRKAAIYSIANYDEDKRAVDALVELAKR